MKSLSFQQEYTYNIEILFQRVQVLLNQGKFYCRRNADMPKSTTLTPDFLQHSGVQFVVKLQSYFDMTDKIESLNVLPICKH